MKSETVAKVIAVGIILLAITRLIAGDRDGADYSLYQTLQGWAMVIVGLGVWRLGKFIGGEIKNEPCDLCHRTQRVTYVEFYKSISYFVARRTVSVKGTLCETCLRKCYREYTVPTVLTGWFGITAFFVAMAYVGGNTILAIYALRRL